MILVAVTLDLGRLAFARVTMENAAREGAMQAAKTPMSYSEDQPCPAGAGSNLVVCRTQLESQGSPITITPADIRMACAPDCDPGIGNTVTVNVTGTFRLLTPLLSVFFGGASNLLISSSASAQIETLPITGFHAAVGDACAVGERVRQPFDIAIGRTVPDPECRLHLHHGAQQRPCPGDGDGG